MERLSKAMPAMKNPAPACGADMPCGAPAKGAFSRSLSKPSLPLKFIAAEPTAGLALPSSRQTESRRCEQAAAPLLPRTE